MQAYDVGDGSARVRWLLVGQFSAEPNGHVTIVRKGEVAEAMARAQLHVTVNVADRLGGVGSRAVELGISNLTGLKLDGVVKAVASLASLEAVANDLMSADPDQRPSPEEAIARVVEAAGDGALASALTDLLSPEPSAAKVRSAAAPSISSQDPHPDTGPTGSPTPVDRIFAQVDVERAPRKPAASAVDSFVQSMRAGKGGAAYRTPTSQARKAREIIEEVVFATAADVLRHPAVAALEGAWRGVKLVLDQSPSREEIEAILLDVVPETLPGSIEEVLPAEIDEWPDAIFLLDACEDPAMLTSLCELAEGLNIPLVAAVSPETLVAVAGSDMASLPDGWQTLRNTEASRWLSVCANRVVLAVEGFGAAKRVVFGSPTLMGAALLTASYRDTGSFGRVFGKQGALRIPATWQPPSGPAAEAAIPVESFLSIDAQNSLSDLGIAAFGSARNSDQIRMTRWPTAHDSEDAVPLPAQVITGRIVRFAQWVRDQLPPGVGKEDVERIFADAASVFLFGGLSKGAEVGATIEQEEGSPPRLKVAARVHSALASVPLTLVFPLAMRS